MSRISQDILYPYRSAFLGLLYRILNINHKKELLWSLWLKYTEKVPEGLQRLGLARGSFNLPLPASGWGLGYRKGAMNKGTGVIST